MNIEFISLASGSNGNCHLVRVGKTTILVDAGMSGKYIKNALQHLDVALTDISAVLVTHEHQDHINALGVIARQAKLPIYLTEASFAAGQSIIGKVDRQQVHFIDNHQTFELGNLLIKAHPVMHDAADPVCYSLETSRAKVAIVTDLGNSSVALVEHIKDADLLLLEANHDCEMLEKGPYPYPLKQRVLSDYGHLSNDKTAEIASQVLACGRLKTLILGHLSGENNTPQLAFQTVANELASRGYRLDKDYNMDIAYRGFSGSLYNLG